MPRGRTPAEIAVRKSCTSLPGVPKNMTTMKTLPNGTVARKRDQAALYVLSHWHECRRLKRLRAYSEKFREKERLKWLTTYEALKEELNGTR